LKLKKHCYSGDKISELHNFERKRKTTLDLNHEKLKIARGEKQGWLQHRLQLGIPLPYEAGRIVDQMPILGKWSHELKSTKKFKEKDRREGKLRFVLQKVFLNSNTLSKHG